MVTKLVSILLFVCLIVQPGVCGGVEYKLVGLGVAVGVEGNIGGNGEAWGGCYIEYVSSRLFRLGYIGKLTDYGLQLSSRGDERDVNLVARRNCCFLRGAAIEAIASPLLGRHSTADYCGFVMIRDCRCGGLQKVCARRRDLLVAAVADASTFCGASRDCRTHHLDINSHCIFSSQTILIHDHGR